MKFKETRTKMIMHEAFYFLAKHAMTTMSHLGGLRCLIWVDRPVKDHGRCNPATHTLPSHIISTRLETEKIAKSKPRERP